MSLARFAGPSRLEVAGHAALIADALQSYASGFGIILGAGLIHHEERLRPMVVAAATKEFGAARLDALPNVREIVRAALQTTDPPDWFSDIVAFSIPPPQPQLAPGDQITNPNIGTVGCRVTWNGGSGFLTAGHV